MVTRLWGKADSFELVFSPIGELWQTEVPADLEDGQYVVELYCEDDGGNRAYWTGILYLNKSECVKVRIVADKFKLWLVADLETVMESDQKVWLLPDGIDLSMTCVDYVGRG